MKKSRWLDRRIAAPGPRLTLCLSVDEYAVAMHSLQAPIRCWLSDGADATAHLLRNGMDVAAIVCMDNWQGRDPVEVAGMLVHEAVHIWQEYAASIGEDEPGSEQEAYAIQAISQELMAEFAYRVGART